jgi:hypothetical protein
MIVSDLTVPIYEIPGLFLFNEDESALTVFVDDKSFIDLCIDADGNVSLKRGVSLNKFNLTHFVLNDISYDFAIQVPDPI